MIDLRDFKLDVTGVLAPTDAPPTPRPFLRVQFACCNVYQPARFFLVTRENAPLSVPRAMALPLVRSSCGFPQVVGRC